MINKTYLLNHPDFVERREKITNRLKAENIDYGMVDIYPPNEIDYEGMTMNFSQFQPLIIEQVGRYSYYNYPKKISPGSLSLVLKHIHCWKDQLKNNYDISMIIEDDCDIVENFQQLTNQCSLEMIDLDLDLVMLGGFSDFVSPNFSYGKLIHFHPLQKTRCTHAYLISKNAAKIMIDGFGNINNPIDIKMNEVIQINKLKVGWLEPGLKQI